MKFYKMIMETFDNIKEILDPGKRRRQNACDEFCSRLMSGGKIMISELGYVERMCKLMSKEDCRKVIENRFGALKRAIKKKKRDDFEKKKKKRSLEDRNVSDNSFVDGVPKKYKEGEQACQEKHVFKKENDVSWGILPKKYRKSGKTSINVLEKAISGEVAEDNLFLHIGDVSSGEEEAYFSEENVNRLNKEDGKMLRPVRCNFGGEYNCKNCVEYGVRMEYEGRKRRDREREENFAKCRKKEAKEKWEAMVPKSYFYFERDIGVDRVMMRYVTDGCLDPDDLEDDERAKLDMFIASSKKKRLFNVNGVEEVYKAANPDGNGESSWKSVVEGCDADAGFIPGEHDEDHIATNGKGNDVDTLKDKDTSAAAKKDEVRSQIGCSNGNAELTGVENSLYKTNDRRTESKLCGVDNARAFAMHENDNKQKSSGFLDRNTLQEGFASVENYNAYEMKPPLFECSSMPSEYLQVSSFQSEKSVVFGDHQDKLKDESRDHPRDPSLFKRRLEQPLGDDIILRTPDEHQLQTGTSASIENKFDNNFLKKGTVENEYTYNGQTRGFIQLGDVPEKLEEIGGKNVQTSFSDNTFALPTSEGVHFNNIEKPQRFGFIGMTAGVPSAHESSGGFSFGTGKSLFEDMFSKEDHPEHPTKPSIEYSVSGSTGSIDNIFHGGGIFSGANDDPFERSNRPARRR